MTVELDEEKGPQIRVEQGQETAVFLNLWKGHMVVHKGRRSVSQGSNWKLYFVKGKIILNKTENPFSLQDDEQLTILTMHYFKNPKRN